MFFNPNQAVINIFKDLILGVKSGIISITGSGRDLK